MTKTIEIAGKEVRLRATASVPRLYRIKFNRDIFADLQKSIGNTQKEATIEDMTVMENVVYIMAMHGNTDDNGNVINADFPKTVNEWLAQFDGVFSIYGAFQSALELWGLNMQTTSNSKKKFVAPSAK